MESASRRDRLQKLRRKEPPGRRVRPVVEESAPREELVGLLSLVVPRPLKPSGGAILGPVHCERIRIQAPVADARGDGIAFVLPERKDGGPSDAGSLRDFNSF